MYRNGYYIFANDNTRRTPIGVLQLGTGTDHPITALRASNDFLDTTRRQQINMFGEHLLPMRMGGPAHVQRHTSFVFYHLAKPDDDAMGAQDERDYRLDTMTHQQIRDRLSHRPNPGSRIRRGLEKRSRW